MKSILKYSILLPILFIQFSCDTTEPQDCFGVANGTASLDDCRICSGGTTGVIANEGDIVEIFGENLSVSSIAKSINTIPYEIYSTLNRRLKRIYSDWNLL